MNFFEANSTCRSFELSEVLMSFSLKINVVFSWGTFKKCLDFKKLINLTITLSENLMKLFTIERKWSNGTHPISNKTVLSQHLENSFYKWIIKQTRIGKISSHLRSGFLICQHTKDVCKLLLTSPKVRESYLKKTL